MYQISDEKSSFQTLNNEIYQNKCIKCQYETLIEEIGKEKADFIMNVLGYKVIDSKDIILSPKLLKK